MAMLCSRPRGHTENFKAANYYSKPHILHSKPAHLWWRNANNAHCLTNNIHYLTNLQVNIYGKLLRCTLHEKCNRPDGHVTCCDVVRFIHTCKRFPHNFWWASINLFNGFTFDLRFKASSCTSGTLSMWLCVTDVSKTSPLASVWIIALQTYSPSLYISTTLKLHHCERTEFYYFEKTIHFLPSRVRPSILIYTKVTWRKFQNLSGKGSLHGQLLLSNNNILQTFDTKNLVVKL